MPTRRAARGTHPELSPRMLEVIAGKFRALGEPSRLLALQGLRSGEATVGDLAATTGLTTATLSRHLQLLHMAGFVRRRRDGLFVWYALADAGVVRLCELMCDRVERDVARSADAIRG